MEMVGIVIGAIILLTGLSCCIFGFRTVGVAAGSCAACCQSAIGNVVRGSCFALMTSLAMRGCFIAMIVIGLIALAIFGIYAMINSEWFQEALDWFQKVGAWFSNVGEWFQNLGEWAKNWFTRNDKKFLAF